MDNTSEPSPLLRRLQEFGDPLDADDWPGKQPDYVGILGLTNADVPELVAIAKSWIEPYDWPEDKKDFSGYAPVHAWRCLAQMKAVEAVHPLLEIMAPADAEGDEYIDEFVSAFTMMGPPAIFMLRSYLADTSHPRRPRNITSEALKEIAVECPEFRDEVVRALTDVLSRYETDTREMNAFIVADLLDLKAVESAEVIERAHAADAVDLSFCGNWNDVKQELGVAGLGLVPDELADAPFGIWDGSEDDDEDDLGDDFEDDEDDLEDDFCDETSAPKPSYLDQGSPPAIDDEITLPIRASEKIGRNEPCPCGSGKKYKKCHGK